MSHFPLLSEVGSHKELQPLYEDMVQAGFGTEKGPINFFKGMAIRPDILGAAWGLTKTMLCQGRLPLTLRQLITMAVSRQNETPYCCATHAAALVALGVPREVIESCSGDPELAGVPSPTREVLLFAKKVAASPKYVTKADHEAMRDLGLSDEEILEVVMLAAFANWTNTWADAAAIPVD